MDNPDRGRRPELNGAGWLYILMGVIALIGGAMAFANPMAASVAVVQIVAAVFLVVGVMQVWSSFQAPGFSGWDLALGVLQVLVGIVLFTDITGGMISLTLMVALLILLEGLFLAWLGWQMRPQGPWLWVFLSGVVSLVLAVMILTGLPASAASILGLLLGIDLVSNGIWLVMLGTAVRRIG
jgi:uncharacterized membrane protein HdeD (DUF308 family)